MTARIMGFLWRTARCIILTMCSLLTALSQSLRCAARPPLGCGCASARVCLAVVHSFPFLRTLPLKWVLIAQLPPDLGTTTRRNGATFSHFFFGCHGAARRRWCQVKNSDDELELVKL